MMLVRSGVIPLILCFLVNDSAAIDLDVNSQDSTKLAAKSLASTVVAFYDESLDESLTPGVFPYPYFWWEAGLAFNTLIDYSGLTHDSQYNARISEALEHQIGDYGAFMPANQTKNLGNSDQSFWALASLSAHQAQIPPPASGSWLGFAQNVFDTQVDRWDDASCDGGLKWQIFTFNDGYDYKNAESNGQFFLLAARLAQQTGNATYAEWANKVFNWTTDVGLVSEDYHVYAGADDKQNCSSINRIQWTSNHGIFTEGAALMYNLSNAAQNWTEILTGFVNVSSTFTEDGGALTEAACEKGGKCDIDQRAFKGIGIRSFGRAAQVAPAVAESLQAILNASAKGAAKNCKGSGENVACGLSWSTTDNDTEATATASDGNLGEVLNALSAVQALLWSTIHVNSSVSSNASASDSPSGNSINDAQRTGAGTTLAASFTLVLAIAFAAALSC